MRLCADSTAVAVSVVAVVLRRKRVDACVGFAVALVVVLWSERVYARASVDATWLRCTDLLRRSGEGFDLFSDEIQ